MSAIRLFRCVSCHPWSDGFGSNANRRSHLIRRRACAALLLATLTAVAACGRHPPESWELTDIRGNLPDLQFTLVSDQNRSLEAGDLRGKIVLLFFGYTHCPDVCPMTMSRLGGVLHDLGKAAESVRILFVSVDPRRDTSALAATYARAFSPQAIGATGSAKEIETLARRYRVAYQALPADRYGNYDVMHSKAVYVFDRDGRARLMIRDTDPPKAIVHDLRQLAEPSS